MAKKNPKKSSEISLGLYMTADMISIAETAVLLGRPHVTAIGSAPTPAGCVVNGTVFEPPRMAQAVRLLMRQMNVSAACACVAFPTDAYSVRSFRLPEAPLIERRALVRGELAQANTLAPIHDEFDFLWLSAPDEHGRKQADACVYYSDAAAVESIRETMRLAGLEMTRLEPASLALLRAYTAVKPDPVAVLCPFAKHSDLAIFDGTEIRSLRRIPTGFDDFQADSNVPQPSIRPRRGLNGEHIGGPVLPSSETSDAAAPGSLDYETNSVSFLAGEVSRSLAFFAREFPDVMRQQKLVILGDKSVATTLCALLLGLIPVPAVYESPLGEYGSAAADSADAGTAHNRLIAIGASLGGIVASVPAINLALISNEALISRNAPAALLAGMSASTIWMTAAIVAAGVLTYLNSQKLRESAEIANVTTSIEAVRAPMLLKQQIAMAVQRQKTKSQVPAASILGCVAVSSTQGVALTSLKISNDGKIALEGKAANSDRMQRFADTLGRGKAITSPVFEAMRQDPKEGLTFRIVGGFHSAPPGEINSSKYQ